MPDATPTSIDPPSPARRNRRWVAVQYIFAAIVILSIAWQVSSQWQAFRHATFDAKPEWRLILASGAVVLATYALLIEVWRRILGAWQAQIGFADAARIWFVSNLGKYVPGKVWQILAMGKMAAAVHVPPAAAAGSAILSTIVNIAMGLVVAVIAGWAALDRMTGGHAYLGIVVATAIVGGVLLLPMLLPSLVAAARRVTGRNLDLGTLPHRAVYIAAVGNLAAWVAYGWSFQLLVHGVLGRSTGRFTDYVAAYALSYVIGYLVFVVPGGVGVREVVQTGALTAMGLATPKEALVVAAVSRLWLTLLEVVPGLLYAAYGARPRFTANRS